ncbi:MAG TPA: hypothetical protein VLU54_05780 [Casimicrobiaceae bacterium]|nr:hypothetical protein [Casimicrobiaceae bacterium]
MNLRIAGVLALAALATAPGAGAIEKWGPTWSEVTGVQWSKAKLNLTGAIIKQIDGKSETDRVVKVEPGKRAIVVQSPTRKGFSGTDATVEVDLAPCKRYYINAQFKSGTGRDWEPVLAMVETVAGCKVPAGN